MSVNSLKKDIDREKKKRAKKLKEQVKKFNESKSTNEFVSEQEHDNDILELYQKMSPQQKAAFNAELEKKKIRDNYATYLKYIYPKYVFTRFHALLCNICQSVVEKVENGQKVRLCLSVPPQHGKSHTVTETLPSWFLGRNPDLRAILTAYNADIAEKFGNKNRQLVRDFGKKIFGLDISESQDNKTLWDIDKHQGGLYSAGILGGITSNTSQLTIVDDPFKNGQEADNPEIREKIWETFTDSVLTRSQGKGNAVIVIHTRWHDDDLIGRLIKLGGWIIINIPCVWESGVDKMLGRKIGETLCPELGFDSEWATQMQKMLGQRKWNALYQGKPYIDGGNLINRSSLRFYNEQSKPASFDTMEMSCDLTFGKTSRDSDRVCIGIWGRVGANHYLLKKVKKKMNFQETLQTLRILSHTYPQARKKLVEAKANGIATIQTLNGEIGGFVEFNPGSKSKQERFENVIPLIESGNVFLPDESIDPTIEDDIEEMLKFPNYTHDDFVDMLSQYLLNYEYRYGGKIQTDDYFSRISDIMRGIKL